jgi:hypothetical protein
MQSADVRVTVEADVDAEALEKATASAREAAVLELYRLGRITSGAGAILLGIGRVEFLELAGSRGIPTCQLTPGELDEEYAGV